MIHSSKTTLSTLMESHADVVINKEISNPSVVFFVPSWIFGQLVIKLNIPTSDLHQWTLFPNSSQIYREILFVH